MALPARGGAAAGRSAREATVPGSLQGACERRAREGRGKGVSLLGREHCEASTISTPIRTIRRGVR
jgi:hypothetical protein